MVRSLKWLAGSVALVALSATGAAAQNISNETWLGQVGGTNTITINQSGRNNQAGADNMAYRLNQDGNDNVLSIDQFGHRNQAGAAPLLGLTGINQIGGSNTIDIVQHTAADALSGINIVGAVRQHSAYVLLEPTNILTIRQNEDSGLDGAAGHMVGTVRQDFTGGESHAPNTATITQTGGGLEEGNYLGSLQQTGTANLFDLMQHNQSNEVTDARQFGSGNVATVTQGLLTGLVGGNLLQYLHQFGVRNVSEVVMQGSQNAIQRIFQFNAHLGASASGNKVKVTLSGEDNGSTGNGGIGDFRSTAARDVSAAQGNIVQIGDENLATITITGTDNKFGTQQFGERNYIVVAVGALDGEAAQRNESAVFQIGTENYFTHDVLGSDNVGAARQFGDYNRLAIEQSGNGNLARAMITGDRNNSDGRVFTDLVRAMLPSGDVTPGRLYQNGLGNSVSVTVTGSDNLFGVHQHGAGNVAESIIVGGFNQVAVMQVGDGNVALTAQYGSGNIAVIRQ